MKRLFINLLLLFVIGTAYSQNILMMGDSHTRGKTFPLAIKRNLSNYKHFNYDGQNGFTLKKYTSNCLNRKVIANNNIFIVAFGTNESYKYYDEISHRETLYWFYRKIKTFNPSAKIIFIAPIPNRVKVEDNRLIVNNRTKIASTVISHFSKNHIDCYFVETPLLDTCYYQRDNVHLTNQGYRKLGNKVGTEINAILRKISSY